MSKGLHFKTKLHNPKTATREELLTQINEITRFLVALAEDFEMRIGIIYDHEKYFYFLETTSREQRAAWRDGDTKKWDELGQKCQDISEDMDNNTVSILKNIDIVLDEDKLTLDLLRADAQSIDSLKNKDIDEYNIEEHELAPLLSDAKSKLKARQAATKEEIETETKIMAIHRKLAELIRKQHAFVTRLKYLVEQEKKILAVSFTHQKQKFDPSQRESHEKYLLSIISQIHSILMQEKLDFYDPFNSLARQEITPIDRLCNLVFEKKKQSMRIDIEQIRRIYMTFTEPEEIHMLISAIKSNPDAFTEEVQAYTKVLWQQSRKKMEDIKLRATHDLMMHIKNRSSFERDIATNVKEKIPFAIIMIDIDHFKNFNDTYGHDIGDKVLIEVGAIIKSALQRPKDNVYRIGGEEIVVLLPSTDLNGGIETAERIRKAIERHPMTDLKGELISPVTVSSGVVAIDDYEHVSMLAMDVQKVVKQIMKQADNELYSAKHEGRNRVKASLFAPTIQ